MALFPNIQMLTDSVPVIPDKTKVRLEFVGAKTSRSKLERFNFHQNTSYWTCWETTLKYSKTKKIYVEIYLTRAGIIYDILCFTSKDDLCSDALSDYSKFYEPLREMLRVMTIVPPPSDIYSEWYFFSELYSLEEIFTKDWAKEWCPDSDHFTNQYMMLITASRYIYVELHEALPNSILHEMAYILNHCVYGGIWGAPRILIDSFRDYDFEHPCLIRIMIAIVRHLDKHPCRTCLFELLNHLSALYDSPAGEVIVLLKHVLKFENLSNNELMTISLAFEKLEQYEASIECHLAILVKDPQFSCSLNNIKSDIQELQKQDSIKAQREKLLLLKNKIEKTLSSKKMIAEICKDILNNSSA